MIDILIMPWLINSVIRTARDKQRADTIEVIARAAAGQILAEYPDKEWAQLLDLVVRQIGSQLPTQNPSVIRRVAASALAEFGARERPL